jgi:hypothetical protein
MASLPVILICGWNAAFQIPLSFFKDEEARSLSLRCLRTTFVCYAAIHMNFFLYHCAHLKKAYQGRSTTFSRLETLLLKLSIKDVSSHNFNIETIKDFSSFDKLDTRQEYLTIFFKVVSVNKFALLILVHSSPLAHLPGALLTDGGLSSNNSAPEYGHCTTLRLKN